MAGNNAPRDGNFRATILGVSSLGFTDTVTVAVNPSTHAILVEGGGGGTQYTNGDALPANPVGGGIIFSNGGTATFVSAANPLPVSASFSPSGTQDINLKQINGNTTSVGNGVAGTGVQRVTIASDNTAFSVNATLTAETTKVIGTVNQGTSPWVVSGTVTANAGTGSFTVVQATGSNLHTVVDSGTITTVSTVTNVATIGTSVTPGTAAANLGKAEDAGHTTGDTGVFVLGVRNDTLATTTNTDADYTQMSTDLKGRVMVGSAPRNLKLNQVTTITASASETTIVTAVASTFLDLYGIIITNTSATAVTVAIKDATAGTTRFNIAVPAVDTRGFMLPIDAAIKQSATNANWTATTQSVTSVIITALTVSNI